MSTNSRCIAQNILADENDLVAVRTRTKQLAALCGLGVQEQTRILTAVSEVARNALLYALGGRVEFEILWYKGRQYLQIAVLDRGPGIDSSFLTDEVHGAVGTDRSLRAIKNLVDIVDINTSEQGSNVVLRKLIPPLRLEEKISAWQKTLPSESPNAVLQELQEQNKLLVTVLDDMQKVQSELEERTRQLQQANELKAQFLANVSHEIRTPMNAILGLTNILSKRAKEPEDLRLLSLLDDSASALLKMINDILDLSKIDEGKLAIDLEPFSLPDLLENIVALFANEAEKRSVSLSLNVAADVPTPLLGDVNRIRQIMINLVGNALKFSDKGVIQIVTSLAWTSEDRISVKIAVEDQGIGIKEKDLANLFEPFSQLDDAAQRRLSGTGLGLSISKRLTELLGGQIGVSSTYGHGSTFWVEIPFDVLPSASAPQPKSGNLELPKFPGRRILLAEDHPVNQIVACDFLQQFDVDVTVAQDGLEVLKALQDSHFDLILMDCQMPELDGFEATAAIRDLEKELGNRTPIIAITANAMAGDKELCLSRGMDDYLSKPYTLDALASVLNKWLTDSLQVTQRMFDVDALLNRFKVEQAKRLLETFALDTNDRLVKVREALAVKDFVRIARDAHALKGAAALMSMEPLKLTCGRLERACQQGDLVRAHQDFDLLVAQFRQTEVELESFLKSIASE